MQDGPIKLSLQLPKGALSRVRLGDAFAENDRVLLGEDVFVKTPALRHAADPESAKCFYVGRRGTGKTAITLYIETNCKQVLVLNPLLIAPDSVKVEPAELKDVHQRHFKTLVSCFKRALALEVLSHWIEKRIAKIDDFPDKIKSIWRDVKDLDFDLKLLQEMKCAFDALSKNDEQTWIRYISGTKDLIKQLGNATGDSCICTVLIDKIDDAWDGSEKSVAFLTGLMHACIELGTLRSFIRPMLFLRENIFDRVKNFDSEFAKLQSSVVSMDWSRSLLLELIERRLNSTANQKIPLGGPTWDCFFEEYEGKSSREYVFGFCQERPRDVLAFCTFAVESAQRENRNQVSVEDLQAARKRFSESRLKELGDEYAENYPRIQHVLSKFYGLGSRFTIKGIESIIKKLLASEDVQEFCGNWIFRYTAPELFVNLLYGVGFFGVGEPGMPAFRPLGASASAPPPLTTTAQAVVHPSYADALGLHNILIDEIDPGAELRCRGVEHDTPEGLALRDYLAKLTALDEDLKTLPLGKGGIDGFAADQRFEDIVGDVVKLCFFRSLINISPKVRNFSGRVIRDWMATNIASQGYWEVVRNRYHAIEIAWECKNYENLEPGDFLQAGSYMTQEAGRFSVIVFRGDIRKHYFEHIKRVAADKGGGVVLLLNHKDLEVFIRQAKAGKTREEHLQERHSNIVRAIS